MPNSSRSRSIRLCALTVTALCWLVAAFAPRPAGAVIDCANTRNPAKGVDTRLWGSLQPADSGQLPGPRDSTNYFGQTRPDSKYPMFTSLDIENGYVFTSYLSGFQIWDIRSTPNDPVLLSVRDGWKNGDFPGWYLDGENRELIYDVDVPEGRDDVLALAGISPAGFTIWSTVDKGNPYALYQDLGKESNAVYATVINGREYAFVAAGRGSATIRGGMGVQMYDMTAAKSYTRCLDTADATSCPGVWVSRVGAAKAVTSIEGLVTGSGKHLVASSAGLVLKGLEIWDVSNPAAPVRLHSSDRLLSTSYIGDVAMWEQNGKQYLGVHLPGEGRIYDITSCVSGPCSSIDNNLVASMRLSSAPSDEWFISFSRSGNTPFLYFGLENFCNGGRQKEFLFNVSNPASPEEITPKGTITVDGDVVDYWGWYDVGSPTGFASVMPRHAKFNNEYLYRAAWSIFDVHKWTQSTPAPPVANFSWSPAEIYPGDNVTFTDASSGNVDTRTWSFQDGTPASSAATAAVVKFATPGSKSVSLTAANNLGPSSKTQTVTVLDPAPVVASASVSPSAPLVCQPVTFTANGVSGRPVLTTSWVVTDGGGATVKTGTGASITWDTAAATPGTYTGTVTVSNPYGSPATRSVNVTLAALTPLPGAGQFTPSNDTFVAGTVKFHANATGATRWIWDFGDGSAILDTTDPVNGPNPTHSYTKIGNYNVTVRVSNCQNQTGVLSAALPVTILVATPLTIDDFQVQGCKFGVCEFGVNQVVNFTTSVQGDPDTYQYDWNGDGTFEETSTTPVLTHKYTTSGSYVPAARIKRGAESVSRLHGVLPSGTEIIISNTNVQPPAISVFGASSGKPNESLSFSATATNCTSAVSDAGWTWSAPGGSVTGSGSAVTVVWTSEGSKTVTATHSSCGSASGSRSVTISNGGGGGGGGGGNGLTASFTYSPAAPKVGNAVTFDGAGSSGTPTSYLFKFGDGQQAEGAQVSHTYGAPGTYTVILEISKPGSTGPGCSFGVCSATTSKQVVVTGGIVADFTSNAECVSQFGVNQCTTKAGVALQLTANAPGATTFAWDFGDGDTATGATVSHTFAKAGSYLVKLTAGDGQVSASATRTFIVSDDGTTQKPSKSVVLPWIAQTRGALDQSSDLYVYNPSASPMDITLEFRKRGLPESNPPRVTKTIAAGATLYVGDVLRQLFSRENIAGFISLVVDKGDAEPIITSFNTTFQTDGKQFGQTISGVSLGSGGSAATSNPTDKNQHLVGLINNSERLAYFGVSNPTDTPTTFRLHFYDKTGKAIAESQDETVSRYGQRQYQAKEITDSFGISNLADYRIVIETKSGGQLIPYASNLRLSSQDPSFIEAGSSKNAKSYLIGVLSAPGLNNSLWQSDVLLSNTNTQAVTAEVTFTALGLNAAPTAPFAVTLQPGQTERLENIVAGRWGIKDGVGVLTVKSTSANTVFPIVQGESYENTNPTKRFGQAMTAVSDASAATAGRNEVLVGLRQDSSYRTTFWLFNPSDTAGEYDVVYRSLDGAVLGRTNGVKLGAGKIRQFSPGQHPLPAAGVANGFTVQIVVKSGKALAAAQVINNLTNDPAYIKGEAR